MNYRLNKLLNTLEQLGAEVLQPHILLTLFAVSLLVPVVAAALLRLSGGAARSNEITTATTPLPMRFLVASGAFLLLYCAAILWRSDFALFDYHQFTHFALVGIDYPPSVWPDLGRFFPLNLQEFNPLSRISHSITLFHLVSIVQLAAVLWLINRVLSELAPWLRGCALAPIVVTPSFVISFFDPLYMERNIILLLALMMWALRGYAQRPTALLFIVATAAASVSLYYKETMFLLVGTYFAVRLLLRLLADAPLPKGWWQKVRRLTLPYWLELTVLLLVAVFLALYVILVALRTGESDYADSIALGVGRTLIAYLKSDPWFVLFPAVCAVRLWQVVKGSRLNAFWDPWVPAILLHVASYGYLQIHAEYYTAQADVIAILYTAWVVSRLPPLGVAARKLAAAGAALFFIVTAAHGTLHVLGQKAEIAGKTAFAEFAADQASVGANPVLFLPKIPTWELMNFSTFFEHHAAGYPAEQRERAEALRQIRLYTPMAVSNGHCAGFYPEGRCEYRAAPQRGDYVVESLIRDEESCEPLNRAIERSSAQRLVWSYEPGSGTLARWLGRLQLCHQVTADWNQIRIYQQQ